MKSFNENLGKNHTRQNSLHKSQTAQNWGQVSQKGPRWNNRSKRKNIFDGEGFLRRYCWVIRLCSDRRLLLYAKNSMQF